MFHENCRNMWSWFWFYSWVNHPEIKWTWCFKAADVVYHLLNIRSKDRELQWFTSKKNVSKDDGPSIKHWTWLISRGKVSPSAIVGSGRFMVSLAGHGFQHHLSHVHAWQFPVTITLNICCSRFFHVYVSLAQAPFHMFDWCGVQTNPEFVSRDHFKMILMGKPASCKR